MSIIGINIQVSNNGVNILHSIFLKNSISQTNLELFQSNKN